jgi:hypothetical protein
MKVRWEREVEVAVTVPEPEFPFRRRKPKGRKRRFVVVFGCVLVPRLSEVRCFEIIIA